MIRRLRVLAITAFSVLVSAASGIKSTPVVAQYDVLSQKTVYDLLWHIDQPDKVHPGIYKLGISWDIGANIDLYTNKAAVTEFLQRYNYGMIPRGKIFSIYYPDHLDEAVALFEILYTAQDIQTFFNTAAWARVHMNEDLFIYVFNVAIIHRPDTANIRLPYPYEIQPNYYFNIDVLQQAYDYKMGLSPNATDSLRPQTFIVQANYTHSYITDTRDPEMKLTYYLEDVGLNAYYYFFHLESPFWMSSEKYNVAIDYRGELYYYIHKLLMNRYQIERLSHGLDKVELFDWDKPIMTGYKPALVYRNGFQFPQRNEWTSVPVHKYGFLERAREFESRITAAIDHGYIPTKTGESGSIYTQKLGLNMIGNIIEGNADSSGRDFYGSIDHVSREIFGFSPEPNGKYQILPSALHHFSTSLRDPGFYRIYNRILNYFTMYKEHINAYTRDDLIFNGVQIESVAIDKLVTLFDSTDSLISNVVRVRDHDDAETVVVRARQYRLNHKPFTYHMTIKSDKETNATVRIFLGPKYNVHGIKVDVSENYKNFYQLDYFITELKIGTNKIDRKSSQADFTTPEYESSDVFYKKILEAVKHGVKLTDGQKLYGFPNRLILPKGTVDGLPVQFIFFASAFDQSSSQRIKSRLIGEWIHDNKPFGFPLDRRVFGYNFTVPNMLFKDVNIYHKRDGESNFSV